MTTGVNVMSLTSVVLGDIVTTTRRCPAWSSCPRDADHHEQQLPADIVVTSVVVGLEDY